MKLLVLAASYPHAKHPYSGLFNERCVAALAPLCEAIEVVVPRPFCPPVLARFSPRWKIYSEMPKKEVRGGVPIWRPAHVQVPAIGGPLWIDRAGYLCLRRLVRALHRRVGFDAILSFDLLGTGGLAWRFGRKLGIPAAGYATGDDVKVPARSSWGRMLRTVVERLDLVFYQSRELLEKVAELLATDTRALEAGDHAVLPRGIPGPPALRRAEVRARVRGELGIREDQVLVLSVGRLVRDKGVFELLDALVSAGRTHPGIVTLMVGGKPGFDQADAVDERRRNDPILSRSVRLVPAVEPARVWELLCAADLFAFASHREGMPNSLLEAMAMGVPCVAFAIPPVLEIEAGSGGVALVPPFDAPRLAETLARLSSSVDERAKIAALGRTRVLDHFMVTKNMAKAFCRLSEMVAIAQSSCVPDVRSAG